MTSTRSEKVGPEDRDHEKREVKIEVDSHPKHVVSGTYVVSEFKNLVGVPADKELEQVIEGKLMPLSDTASITIIGGEVFFSHVRRGGAA